MKPSLKFALDFLPLAGFFLGYKLYDLFAGTIAIIVLTALCLAITWWAEKKLALLPLISGGFVAVMGALTLYSHNELFIKIRPTVVNILFAAILLGGAFIWKKGLLKPLFGMAFSLTDAGWLILSKRWGYFFTFLAAMNEIVWRSCSTDFWVNYKVFGVMAMTFVFTLVQVMLVRGHMIDEESAGPTGG